MILIDTGFFLAMLNPRDELHSRARAWSAQAREPLIVTEYVLWETVNHATAYVDRPKLHTLVADVRTDSAYVYLPASIEWFESGLALHARRPDKAWTLTDRISFVVMERRGITRALAYDHHFEQAGFEALLRHQPS